MKRAWQERWFCYSGSHAIFQTFILRSRQTSVKKDCLANSTNVRNQLESEDGLRLQKDGNRLQRWVQLKCEAGWHKDREMKLEFGMLVFVEEENQKSPKKTLGEKWEPITNTNGLLCLVQNPNQATVGAGCTLITAPSMHHGMCHCHFQFIYLFTIIESHHVWNACVFLLT